MPILLALVLGLLALAYVLAPLFRTRPLSAVATGSLNDAIARADEAKQALRDIEFDYRLGNLAENDYTELRATYERHALGALKTRYEREQALDTLLDRELALVRARVAHEADVQKSEIAAKTANAVGSSSVSDASPSAEHIAPSQVRSPATSSARPAPRGPRARRRKGA